MTSGSAFLSVSILALGLLLPGPCGTAYAEEVRYYRSNDQGMRLARVSAALKDQSQWMLKVTLDGADEDRQLYNNGKEVHRWQVSWNAAHTEEVERESSEGALVARRIYDGTQSLQREEEYRDGKLVKTTRYIYEGGRLARRRELDAEGKEIDTEAYVYAENGSLREVSRSSAEGGADRSAWVSGRDGLVDQRSVMDGDQFVERYDADGRLAERQRFVDGTTVSTETFSYSPAGKLESSTERRPEDATLFERQYDDHGRLVSETTRVKDQVTEVSSWEHDADGRVTARTRRGPGGLELWKYRYGPSGDVSREEYSQRGVLVKVTVYNEGGRRTEELYRRGELFLKVFFNGDTRTREEVYSNGDLVRSRDYP